MPPICFLFQFATSYIFDVFNTKFDAVAANALCRRLLELNYHIIPAFFAKKITKFHQFHLGKSQNSINYNQKKTHHIKSITW